MSALKTEGPLGGGQCGKATLGFNPPCRSSLADSGEGECFQNVVADEDGEKAVGDATLAWLPHRPADKYWPPCGGSRGRSMAIFTCSTRHLHRPLGLELLITHPRSAVSVSLRCTSLTHSALVIFYSFCFGTLCFLGGGSAVVVVRGPVNFFGTMVGGSGGTRRERAGATGYGEEKKE